jgi:hypothetical protein
MNWSHVLMKSARNICNNICGDKKWDDFEKYINSMSVNTVARSTHQIGIILIFKSNDEKNIIITTVIVQYCCNKLFRRRTDINLYLFFKIILR